MNDNFNIPDEILVKAEAIAEGESFGDACRFLAEWVHGECVLACVETADAWHAGKLSKVGALEDYIEEAIKKVGKTR